MGEIIKLGKPESAEEEGPSIFGYGISVAFRCPCGNALLAPVVSNLGIDVTCQRCRVVWAINHLQYQFVNGRTEFNCNFARKEPSKIIQPTAQDMKTIM